MLNVSNTVVAASLLFLSQSPAGPPAHSGNGHVILTNNTRQPIVEIYGFRTTAPTIGKRICWALSFYSPAGSCFSMSTIETAIAEST